MTLQQQKQARYDELCASVDSGCQLTTDEMYESVKLFNELLGCDKIMAFSSTFFRGDGPSTVEILNITHHPNLYDDDKWQAQLHVKRTVEGLERSNNVNITLYDNDESDRRIVLEYL